MEQRLAGYARPQADRVYPTAFDQQKETTELRAALPWLADVPYNVTSQLLVDLDRAWRACFARIRGAPRWKRKGRERLSFRESHRDIWRLDEATLHFPKIGPMRAVVHRPLEGRPKTCTLTCDAGQWFASIVCEIEVADPVLRAGPTIALDRGIINAVGDSDGRLVPNPRFYEKAMGRLARAQRVVARRRKGSKNREKAAARVAHLHRKVRRQREHFLHVLSHGYAKSHGVVVIEKLNVAWMTRSGRATLSRGIADAGWSRLAFMLGYKLAWSGGSLIEVPAAFSSQTCSECGCLDARNRAAQAVFRCVACGHTEHADLNAPKILEARASRPGKPVDGTAPEAAERSRKPTTVQEVA
jgi:putative transposase